MADSTIHLATDDDMRAINSQRLDDILRLPFVYIATPEPDVMRVWGVALKTTVPDTARQHPEALVAPRYVGERASRGDLLYNGAEPAAEFT